MDAYRTINDTLVNLFNEIWELEKEAIITEEFKDITNNDMHIIEAIGLSGENTMSSVAKKLKITAIPRKVASSVAEAVRHLLMIKT